MKSKTISQFTDEYMHALNDYIIGFDWTTIISSTDVDECHNLFDEIIDAINSYCPYTKAPLKTSHNPWMTKCLINACRKMNNLYKEFIENRMKLVNKDIKFYIS